MITPLSPVIPLPHTCHPSHASLTYQRSPFLLCTPNREVTNACRLCYNTDIHSSISWAHSARMVVEAHARAQSLMSKSVRNDILYSACVKLEGYAVPRLCNHHPHTYYTCVGMQNCGNANPRCLRDATGRKKHGVARKRIANVLAYVLICDSCGRSAVSPRGIGLRELSDDPRV